MNFLPFLKVIAGPVIGTRGSVAKGGGALDAFAVAKLETLVIDQARFKAEQAAEATVAPVFIEGPAQAAALLESALAQKMGALLAAPATIDLKTIKDLRECLKLVEEMRGRAAEESDKQTGLTQETEDRIKKILAGDL